MAKAKATIDHDEIRRWVEERDGCPAHVRGTGSDGDPGILRIDYPGYSKQTTLEEISWEEFFDAFEENELAFLYQDEKDSRFSKLVSRDTATLTGKSAAKSHKRAAKKGVDAVELLKGQHRQVEEMFEKLKNAKSDSAKERAFGKLADLLAAHTKIEEKLFYPAMFSEETEELLRESVEEHLVVKRLLADLLVMEPSEPQFLGKVLVMEEALEHHIKEEEKVLFKYARSQDEEDLHVLGRRLQRRFDELMESEPSSEVPAETEAAVVSF